MPTLKEKLAEVKRQLKEQGIKPPSDAKLKAAIKEIGIEKCK